MRLAFVTVAVAFLHAGFAAAQSCPPPPPPSGGSLYFEFQVQEPARFTGDMTQLPVPDATDRRVRPFPPDFALAQFVVDSTGVPSPKSLRLLVKPESLSIETVQSALARWRFTPAKVAGCNVPQLVQTPLRWR